MRKGRFAAGLLGAAAAVVFLSLSAHSPHTTAQPSKVRPGLKSPGPGIYEIVQEFPVGGPMQTAWKVRYAANARVGLMIAGAWFKTGPRDGWTKILENVRLSEIFVPYNDGETRLYDIGAAGAYSLERHTQADAGPNGKLLHNGQVVRELRDDGVLWKYYNQVRRAQDLTLWATLGATNYNYITEYSFRCDGSFSCRLGSTGKNLSNHETMGHMHHGCWRIDLDLGDPQHNSAYLVKWAERKGKAKDTVEPFNNGVEGGAVWNAEEFTRVRIQSNQKNAQGNFTSYELVPLRHGSPRHRGHREEFTHHDFWVTPYVWNEQYYVNLPQYVAKKRRITDTNVVLWYLTSAYHLPRDEDGIFLGPNGQAQVRGVALATWCGFEMRPRNLFEKSPLYP
ncbi:MAG: hypothetical protein IT429_22380 [Gemmataceae bacterium]|nr:hypothetical protein [Gemmataceae bacterium]